MSENEFSFKELYDATLKATYPIEVGSRTIEVGETVAAFDRIQIANFQELKSFVNAHGGYNDRGLVYWETTKEVRLNFTQGIFSKVQLALMTNSKLIQQEAGNILTLIKREWLESNENGDIELTQTPTNYCFLYDEFGNRISYSRIGKRLHTSQKFKNLLADYTYDYAGGAQILTVGSQLTQGFLEFQGKTRVKDDITGQTRTGILKIPKLKLMSSLSIQLGQNAMPQVGRLQATALPVGVRGNETVMELQFLSDDIDSDM